MDHHYRHPTYPHGIPSPAPTPSDVGGSLNVNADSRSSRSPGPTSTYEPSPPRQGTLPSSLLYLDEEHRDSPVPIPPIERPALEEDLRGLIANNSTSSRLASSVKRQHESDTGDEDAVDDRQRKQARTGPLDRATAGDRLVEELNRMSSNTSSPSASDYIRSSPSLLLGFDRAPSTPLPATLVPNQAAFPPGLPSLPGVPEYPQHLPLSRATAYPPVPPPAPHQGPTPTASQQPPSTYPQVLIIDKDA